MMSLPGRTGASVSVMACLSRSCAAGGSQPVRLAPVPDGLRVVKVMLRQPADHAPERVLRRPHLGPVVGDALERFEQLLTGGPQVLDRLRPTEMIRGRDGLGVVAVGIVLVVGPPRG